MINSRFPYTGERYTPWRSEPGSQVAGSHIARYAWAAQRLFGKKVVDLGCGCGYGTYMLSWVADSVSGVDCDEATISYCVRQFRAPNLEFLCIDLAHPDLYDALYAVGDCFVALEFLEHLDDPVPIIDNFGPLLWSMPVNDTSQFHARPYSVDDIGLLLPGFKWMQDNNGTIYPCGQRIANPAYVLGVTP